MSSIPLFSAFLATVLPIALAAPTGTDALCSDIASAIPTDVDPTPFCRSYISIPTMPTYIFVPRTDTTATYTADPTTVVRTVATSTLTFCDGGPTNQKREESVSMTSLSPAQKTSEACSCLSVPPETVTHTVSDVIQVTTTPTITLSVTAYETHFGASKTSVPPTYLASPTPVTYRPDDDDFSEPIKNEFPIRYRSVSSLDKDMWGDNYIISVSNQGVLSITSPGAGFAGHIPSALPGWYNGPDFESTLNDNAFVVLWGAHDVNSSILNPQSNLTQRVQYATEGASPSRTLTVEWIVGNAREHPTNVWIPAQTEHYRFWVTFYEAEPERFTYTYWDVSDGGKNATVGVQSQDVREFAQYTFDGFGGHDVRSGLVLDYNYETNSFDASTIYEGLC